MTTLAFTTRYLADGTAIVTDSSDASARYIVWQDESPECPNDWNDATAYVFRAAYLRGDVEVSAHDDDPVFPDEPDFCVTSGCAHQPAGWAVIYRKAA